MSKNSLADLLASSRQMVTAVKANQEQLAARGASEAFIKKGEDTLATLEAADGEQERLKGRLKTMTAQVEALEKGLDDWLSEASKIVKLAYRDEKEKWIEFGIRAKR